MKSILITRLRRTNLSWALILMLASGLAFGLTGCEDDTDLGEATEEAGESIQEGADEVGDAVEDAVK